MAKYAAPGHKLGQMIGNFFEDFFAEDLVKLSQKHGFYCDCKTIRTEKKETPKKVTWTDKDGNNHDLDYVFEKRTSPQKRGVPVAFIELAWRRYTKHSRNKTGEIEGALLPLRDTFLSCGFLGAIIAGEYTEGGKNQLISHEITVLHVPFNSLAESFGAYGVDLTYDEKAPNQVKIQAMRRWKSLRKTDIVSIKEKLRASIAGDYQLFLNNLEKALLRRVDIIRVFPLYSRELVFRSVEDAISALSDFEDCGAEGCKFLKFEVQIRFSTGDEGKFTFGDKADAVHFLRMLV